MNRSHFFVILAFMTACGGGSTPEPADVAPAGDVTIGDLISVDAAIDQYLNETSEPRSDVPLMGFLQFRVRHNLASDACLPDECDIQIHSEEDIVDWLATMRQHSNLAVLHWDRAVPYQAFIDPLPPGENRVAFYDARLPADSLAWINAFRDHFQQTGRSFLAVSLLAGNRTGYQPVHLEGNIEIPMGGACPDFSPGASFMADLPDGQIKFEPGLAYVRFLLYLQAKLLPDYMALMIEMNYIKLHCPESWPGLVSLYRQMYDAVRSQAGPDLPLFATLHLTSLLGYDNEACFELQFTPCDTEPPSDYPEPDPESCFTPDTDIVTDLAEGGRLDILALSYYPDGMAMAPPDLPSPKVELLLQEEDPEGSCLMHGYYGPFVDPLDYLDLLGWDGPVAVAEWSARSCETLSTMNNGVDDYWLRLAGRPDLQRFWMESVLSRLDGLEFAVWSFLEDYDPVGGWIVQQGILDPFIFNVFNTWPCSGLLTKTGEPKNEILDIWLGNFVR